VVTEWLDAPLWPASRHEDLLTLIMRELGHVLELGDLKPATSPMDLRPRHWQPACAACRPSRGAPGGIRSMTRRRTTPATTWLAARCERNSY